MASSNSVTITDNTGLLNTIQYDGTIKFTTGQPCNPPPTVSQAGNIWTITLLCDRKGSSEVADSYVKVVGGGVHMFAAGQDSGDTPNELNFYFGLDLILKQSGSVTVYLGQGHKGTSNNWWFGGSAVSNTGGNKPVLLIGNQNVALSGSTSAFTLSNL